MNNTFKIIDNQISDDGERDGFIIIEVVVQGNTQCFKIPAYMNSSYGVDYEHNNAVPVNKDTKKVNVWKTI